jgi:hypothetical protein
MTPLALELVPPVGAVLHLHPAGLAGVASAASVRDYFLHRGDRVSVLAAINEREAAITRYSGFNRYRVIVRD